VAVEFDGISKRFFPNRKPALRSVSLTLSPGEVLGLVGRNGAGKTTAIRIGAGVALPDGGEVRVDGHPMAGEKREASRRIGWVPEESVHDRTAKVEPLLRYYADVAGNVEKGRLADLLRFWGLAEFRRRRVRTLSLGMKRRLSIIASELGRPQYFLLDEVFNGLDPEAVVSVRSWIRERRAAGCGLLLSSHNLRELATIADRVAVLHEGRLLRILERKELVDRPAREVRVEVPDLGPRGIELLEAFGTVEAVPGGAIVRGSNLDAARVAAALIGAGFALHGLRREQDGLEELFLELVREAS
jgi:ABC-2 type transport system ATP-binding protein